MSNNAADNMFCLIGVLFFFVDLERRSLVENIKQTAVNSRLP
jgi:hypothetical protein